MVVSYLGKEKDAEIRHTATAWFDRLFVRTGVKDRVYRYFIPSEHERQSSIGFQDIGRENLFPFIAARIQVLWDSVYQSMRRFFLMLAWWPAILILTKLPGFRLRGWRFLEAFQHEIHQGIPTVEAQVAG